MNFYTLLVLLSDDIGSLVNAGLLICVPIALIIGFAIFTVFKFKKRYKIVIAILVSLTTILILLKVFFTFTSNM